MRNKEQKTYEIIFKELKENILKYSNFGEYSPKEFHCDFELAISNSFIKIFPKTKIRFCLWYMDRALENKSKNYIKDDNETYMLYKSILNLPFIDPQYVDNVYNIIKEKNHNENFAKFLEYFKDNYINKYQIKIEIILIILKILLINVVRLIIIN